MDIFLSRPTWIGDDFKTGLDIFLSKLSDLELTPRTLGTTDYPTKSPLDEVIKIMKKCRGAVILGYPQIEVITGKVKDSEINPPILLPTEWNHIEAGLAYASSLPLLVIHHNGVCRGIFDRGALNSFIFSKDFKDPTWPNHNDLSGAIRSWRNDVLGYSPTPEKSKLIISLEKIQGEICTLMAINRKITDPRLLGHHRESTACSIKELTDSYARVELIEQNKVVTIPFGDIVVSFDDKRNRPMIELRAI